MRWELIIGYCFENETIQIYPMKYTQYQRSEFHRDDLNYLNNPNDLNDPNVHNDLNDLNLYPLTFFLYPLTFFNSINLINQ